MDSGYKWILAYGLCIALAMLISRTRAGYAAIYYILLLALLFLLVTQSKFIVEALSPLSSPPAAVPAGGAAK